MNQASVSGPELLAMASLATPMAIRVAATMRLPDRIADGQDSVQALASELGADARALEALLRHLCRIGLLQQGDQNSYHLTEQGSLLREKHPARVGAKIDMTGAEGRADLSFVHLLHAVRTGSPAFDSMYGRSFWDDLRADHSVADSFHQRMGLAIDSMASAIIDAYDWGSLDHLVDVGGGNGALLAALLSRYTDLRGTVVDLPHVAVAAERRLASADLGDRASFVSGSFFEPLPTGAGGYLLSAILHNWPDEEARLILRQCAEASAPAGRVFVVEKIGADGISPDTEEGLRGIAYFGAGARERGVNEIRDLALTAGMDVVAVHPASPCAVVELAS